MFISILDKLFLIFFIIHIPITIFIDVQGPVIPRSVYPVVLQELTKWYADEFHDFLMSNPPIWFRSFIYGELIFQLPLLLSCIYGLCKEKSWARITCLIYGVHVTTTLIPILSEFWFSSLTKTLKLQLIGIYSPYLIIPGLMILRYGIYNYPIITKKNKIK